MPKSHQNKPLLLKTWELSPAVTLGSAIRMKGILQELRARLSTLVKKSLELDANELTLIMPADEKLAFNATAAIISKAMSEIDQLPVIPREIEDILTIKTSERKRWLEDGRLPSAGTRTVKLRGRAKKITFHVFDPKLVADLLDRDVVDIWREEDVLAAAENRRRAAYKAKLTRSLRNKKNDSAKKTTDPVEPMINLSDWEEFARDGFLR